MCYLTCSGLGENSLARRDNFSISFLTGRGEGSLSLWTLKGCPHHCHSTHSNWNTSPFKLTEQLLPRFLIYCSFDYYFPPSRNKKRASYNHEKKTCFPKLHSAVFYPPSGLDEHCHLLGAGARGSDAVCGFHGSGLLSPTVARQVAGSLPLRTGSTALPLAAALSASLSSWSFRISLVTPFMSLVSVWENLKALSLWEVRLCLWAKEWQEFRRRGWKSTGRWTSLEGGWNSKGRPILRPELPEKGGGRTHSMAERVPPIGPRDSPPRCHWHTGC